MELLHTERKYVQDLETMQVRDSPDSILDPISTGRVLALRNRSCAIKYNRPGHYPSTFPWPQQAPELPAEVPNQA